MTTLTHCKDCNAMHDELKSHDINASFPMDLQCSEHLPLLWVLFNFLFSATIGGGLGAFLALSNTGLSSTANDVGGKLIDAVGVSIPRISLPDAAKSALSDLDLKNPNDFNDREYQTYSGAAFAGTFALFLPGILVFDVTGALADFVLSALVGGGIMAFLSLRKDGLAKQVNGVGGKFLDAVDSVIS